MNFYAPGAIMNKSQLPTELAERMHVDRPFQESFTYNVPAFTALNFGQTQTQSLQIQSDSDFEVGQMSVMVIPDSLADDLSVFEGEHYSGIVCNIADGATQAPLMNIPVPINNIFGTGKHPRILPQKRLLERNSVLVFTLSNIYTDAACNMAKIIISLQGEKFYRGFQS